MRWIILLAAALTLTATSWLGDARAQDKPAAVGKVGVVLMHGKMGSPEHMAGLAQDLRDQGYLVVTPDMPWSKVRGYDRSLGQAHDEIDALITGLKAQGATRIVIGGHSMGANMAITYAATHPGVAAVLAIGPGQTVEAERFEQELGASVAKARALVEEGRGDDKAVFADLHLGKVGSTTTTAAIYLSYFDPDGLANMPATIAGIGEPLLWIVGDRDKNMLDRGQGYAFDKAQSTPFNRYVVVAADHMDTPEAARGTITDWLAKVLQLS